MINSFDKNGCMQQLSGPKHSYQKLRGFIRDSINKKVQLAYLAFVSHIHRSLSSDIIRTYESFKICYDDESILLKV